MADNKTVNIEIKAQRNLQRVAARIQQNFKKVASSAVLAAKKLKIFAAGVGNIGKKMGLLVAAASSIGALLTTKIFKGINAIDKLGESLGISSQFLQGWQFALSKTGVSVEDSQAAITSLSQALSGVARGDSASIDAFSKLGVTLFDVNGRMRDTETVALEAVEALSKHKDGTGKARIAQKLFGSAALSMAKTLNQGRGALEDNMKKAKEYGLITSDLTNDKIAGLIEKIADMKGRFQGLAITFAVNLLPKIVEVVDKVSLMIAEFQSGSASADPLVASILHIVSAISNAVVGLVEFEKKTHTFADTLRGIGDLINWLAEVFPKFILGGQKMFEWLFTKIAEFVKGGQKVFEDFFTEMFHFGDVVKEVFGETFDYLKEKIEKLTKGLKTLIELPGKLKNKVSNIGSNMVNKVKNVFTDEEAPESALDNIFKNELSVASKQQVRTDNQLNVNLKVRKDGSFEVDEMQTSGDMSMNTMIDLGSLQPG